jgi:hypothetical protein
VRSEWWNKTSSQPAVDFFQSLSKPVDFSINISRRQKEFAKRDGKIVANLYKNLYFLYA